MKGIKIFLVFYSLIWMMGCTQRTQPMEERQGLDNDSRSYSYMGYAEDRMKQAALNVPGVKSVFIEYNGQNLMLYAIPKKQIDPAYYPSMAKQITKKVSDAVPQNSFHVRVLQVQDYFEQHTTG